MEINKVTFEFEPQELSIISGTISSHLDTIIKDYDTFEEFREDYEKELEFLQMCAYHGQYFQDLVPSGELYEGEMTYEHKEFPTVIKRYRHIYGIMGVCQSSTEEKNLADTTNQSEPKDTLKSPTQS